MIHQMVGNDLPLSRIPYGETVIVSRITGGQNVNEKLIDLGIIPGAELSIIKIADSCPILLAIDNARVMIGCGMADKVLVRVKE